MKVLSAFAKSANTDSPIVAVSAADPQIESIIANNITHFDIEI
jgi:hypothetical protein